MACSSTSSSCTGRKVSRPTCRVTCSTCSPKRRQPRQRLRGEVQAGRGRRRRALDAAIDGLVALRVVQALVDVGWQRHLTEIGQPVGGVSREVDDASAGLRLAFDPRRRPIGDAIAVGDPQGRAWAGTAAAHQRLPAPIRQAAQQQQLDVPAALALARPDARGQHASAVEHQHVARPQVARKVAEAAVLDRPALAVQHEHAAGVARLEWLLRDQLGR